MPAPVTSLEIRGVTKAFDGTVAVAGVSLELEPGAIFGLLVPNGAGSIFRTAIPLYRMRVTVKEILRLARTG